MTQVRERAATGATAVLHVARGELVWYESAGEGPARQGSAVVGDPSPGGMVAAALAAWKASGSTRKACVLALAEDILPQRLLHTPDLGRRELAGVFRRKAAALLGGESAPSRVLYCALPAGGVGEDEAPISVGGSDWCLLAMDGGFVEKLRLGLRKRGFRVGRVVSASLSAVARACEESAHPDAALIAVVVGAASVSVNLVQRSRLLSWDRIEGDLLQSPAVATGLVQAVRGSAAFWKKTSRGALVKSVVVQGLPPGRGDLLAHAIASVLPEAVIVALPGPDVSGENAGRFHLLSCANAGGPLNPDLAFPLPPRRSSAALLTAASILLAALLGWGLRRGLSRQLEHVDHQVRLASRRLGELSRREERERLAEAELATLRAHLERLSAIRDEGLPMAGLLACFLGAFRGRADFLGLRVVPSVSSGEALVDATGEVDADPVSCSASLEALSRALEENPDLSGVELELPDRVPENPGDTLRFHVRARVDAS